MTTRPDGVTAFLVREATTGDLAAVRALVAAVNLPLAGLAEAWRVLVAVPDEGPAGPAVGAVALERHGDGGAAALLLRSAAVDPTWRGRGVGAALVASALAIAGESGLPVALLTETAADWFPRFGFRAVDRNDLPPALSASAELQGACPASATAMLLAGR